MKFRATLISLALLLGPAAAHGETFGLPSFRRGMKSAGLHLGVVRPGATGGYSSLLGGGAVFELQYLGYLGNWIALGGELSMQYFLPKKVPDPVLASASADSSASALNLGIFMRVNAFEERAWTPYLLGGIGRHRTSISSVKAGSLTTGSVNAAGMSYTAGGGVEGFVMQDLSLSTEVRFRQYRLEPSAAADHLETLSCQLGIHYWFGLDQ